MATATEKRLMVRNKYREIIGRNRYSQNLRDYCFRRYSDGNYYSDCSSSICYTYKEVGLGFGILNTVGMWISDKLIDVDVIISKGIIQNPGVLRIGDMLLFAGNDVSRSPYGYVGHVEMVGEISGGVVQLYGHGSGNPKRHEMNAYCRTRQNMSAATPLKNRGLIRVRRFIRDAEGETTETTTSTTAILGARILKNGMVGSDVKALQSALIALGYSCGSYGADGDFGDATERAVRKFQKEHGCEIDGEVGAETLTALNAAQLIEPAIPKTVHIVGGDCYVRSKPDKATGVILGVAYEGGAFAYGGETSDEGWVKITYNGAEGWVSGKYARLG